jgi:hypothetical protein
MRIYTALSASSPDAKAEPPDKVVMKENQAEDTI